MDYMSSSGESIQHNAWQSGSSRHVGPVVTNPLLPDADRAEQSARGVNGAATIPGTVVLKVCSGASGSLTWEVLRQAHSWTPTQTH